MSGLFTYKDYVIERSINNDGNLAINLFHKASDKYYYGSITPEEMKGKCPTYTVTTMLAIIDSCCVEHADGCNMDIIITKTAAELQFKIVERFGTNKFGLTLGQKQKTDSDKVAIALSDFMKRMDELGCQTEMMQQTIGKLKDEFEVSHKAQVDELNRIVESFKAEMLSRSFLLNPAEIILPDTIARIPTNVSRLVLHGRDSWMNMNSVTYTVEAKRNPKFPTNLPGVRSGDPTWNHNKQAYHGEIDGTPEIIIEITGNRLSHQAQNEFFPFRTNNFDQSKPESAQNMFPVIPFNHADINQLMLLQNLEHLEINGNLKIINWAPIYNLRNLKVLKLINCGLTDAVIASIIKGSRWANTIEAIHLDENKGVTDLRIFVELPNLKELSYKKTSVGNDICLANVPRITVLK